MHQTTNLKLSIYSISYLDILLQTVIVYLPPANIATRTIPHDQMSAGSAL